MGRTVTWYFDVISPFAYLALGEVEALGRTAPLAYRPVLLAGVLNHWGQLGPAEIGPKRVHTYRMCVFEAARRSLAFRLPPTHPFNPLQALRLLVALDADPAAVRTAMEVIWQEGVDVSAPEGWARLVERLGVEDAEGLIAAKGAKEALRAGTDEAIGRGVFGVPTLAVGDALFWGADAMPLARAALADPGLLERGEMGRIAGLRQVARKRG